MTESHSYLPKMIGSVTAHVMHDRLGGAAGRLAKVREAAKAFKPPKAGWIDPLVYASAPDMFTTAWVQFQVRRIPGTTDTSSNWEPVGIADLPLSNTKRLILIGGGDSKEAGIAQSEYLDVLGATQDELMQVTITNEILKAFFQDTSLFETPVAVQGTELLEATYEGDTSINSPKHYDIRYDSKFTSLLPQPWKMLRVIPSMDLAKEAPLPPPVEMRTEGSTLRSWRRWNEAWALQCLARTATKLIQLEGVAGDSKKLRAAAKPPTMQARLPAGL